MPIQVIDEKRKTDNAIQQEIMRNVDSLIKLYPEISESKLQSKIDQLQIKAEHRISNIDELVYKLYDLTEDEIKIVVGK
jgi:hypothetical protein